MIAMAMIPAEGKRDVEFITSLHELVADTVGGGNELDHDDAGPCTSHGASDSGQGRADLHMQECEQRRCAESAGAQTEVSGTRSSAATLLTA